MITYQRVDQFLIKHHRQPIHHSDTVYQLNVRKEKVGVASGGVEI